MKTSEAFPSKYLKAADIGSNTWRVTVDEIRREELLAPDGRRQTKPVLYFRRIEKGMVLNVTNSRVIEHVYGEEMDDWVGKELVLYTREVEARGQMMNAIRVRIPQPGQSTAPSHVQYAQSQEPAAYASGLPDDPRPAPRRPAAEHPGQQAYSERNPPPHPGPRADMDDEIPF